MARTYSMVLIATLLLAAVAVAPFVGAARDVAADEGRDLSSADAPASDAPAPGPDAASSSDSSEAPSSSSDA
ncbi:hypothetical protein BDA96_05G037300 [Sorghum bicolor]|jgi:hypothetical protein|uniref:Uncharacterized protein n=2 Tax=Sorghum bicolor TaxID=4558 RepID=A0A921QX72_SORBI|nr:hypothetical protein BDA96_05G037300 [Sorghum bicolor]OQU82874.1 hypothetical protein SORBI_3005G035250 [Sorghum bicolor]